MSLFTKLALYNTFIRLVLIGALWLVLPMLITKLNDQHTDLRLLALQQRALAQIEQTGIQSFMNNTREGPSSLLREEYATIIPYKNATSPPIRQVLDHQQAGNAATDYRALSRPIRVKGQLYVLEVGKSLNEVRELSQTLGQLVLGVLAAILIPYSA